MRAVHQRPEVPAPAVLWMQRLPISADGRNYFFAPDDLAVLEEVEIDGAPFQVDRVHGLGATRLHMNGLLLRAAR